MKINGTPFCCVKIIDLANENQHLRCTIDNLNELLKQKDELLAEKIEYYEKNWRPKEKKTLLERLIS